ncbi:MAG: hypothetical protein R6V01_05805 [Thermoplasmatota archaeon]
MDEDYEERSDEEKVSRPAVRKEQTVLFIMIFAVGIIMILLGIFLGSISNVIHEPNEYENGDDYDSYETATRWLNFFSRLSLNTGLIFVACAAFITAIFNPRMHPTLRAGLVVSGGLIIGLNTVIVL